MNVKRAIGLALALIMAVITVVPAFAEEAKPALRLDVRDDKQAILTITDPKLPELQQEVVYQVKIGSYEFKLTWRAEGAEDSNTSDGSLSYFESSDNSIAGVERDYSDGQLAQYAERTAKDTLELQLDLTGPELPLRTEGPRDVSGFLRDISFFELADTAELTVQYDGELNDYVNVDYSYQKDDYFYDRMKGLTFVIAPPATGFDIARDFGRVAGLTEDEMNVIYWTPETDNYLILKSRSEQTYEFRGESYRGMADVYDLVCYDENDLPVSMRQKYVFDDEGGYVAHFRNVETDPRYNQMLARCIGAAAEDNQNDKNITFVVMNEGVVETLVQSGATKSSTLAKLPADTQVVENHGQGATK